MNSIDAVGEALAGQGYLADRALATSVFLAREVDQPLLLEGEAGVGKTEVARALAAATGAELIRLQCHEGIDVQHALYDWDHPRQLLALRQAEMGSSPQDVDLWSERFLIRRPLMAALEAEGPVVLLIDEVDHADDAFEAFLLELLSDFAVTVPELGTVRAEQHPTVVLTSNRTRELHDALKRRCLYHWIDSPDPEREQELYKLPGVGETIAWARTLTALGAGAAATDALGTVLKVHEDLDRVRTSGVLEGV